MDAADLQEEFREKLLSEIRKDAKEEPPPTEAEEYFAQLDYAQTSHGIILFCDNCGYEMDPNMTHLHKLSRARKCSTEMAMQIARGDEWKLLEEAHQAKLREENPPPKAFKLKKPSLIQRFLDWIA